MRGAFWLAIVLAAAGLAGCIGADDLDEDIRSSAVPRTAVLDTNGSWEIEGQGAANVGANVPDGTGAVFVSVTATVPDPTTALEVQVETPDGRTHQLLAGGGPFMSEASNWMVLPAVAGTWSVQANADGDASGSVSIVAPADRPDPQPVAGSGPDRIVVGIIDTGINPYHAVFQRPGLTTDQLPAYIAEAATGSPPISAPTAPSEDYLRSVALDASTWADLPAQRLVHFEGTNVLGYNLDDTTLPELPVLDRAGHGTAVAHSVLAGNPDALVVMITGGDYDEGVAWAANQPWIDVITMSWGPATNAHGAVDRQTGDWTTFEPTRAAWADGKLVFGASANDPTLTFSDTTTGPPWVHAVSGSHASTHSRAPMSGNLVDTVANWTQDRARYDSLDETGSTSGNSFASPLTAGIASRIVDDLRVRAGHTGPIVDGALVHTAEVTVTNSDVREAINATAELWSAADYEGPTDPTPGIPVTPAAPWVSMGWGHVDVTVVAPAVDALLGLGELPSKPAQAQAWMDANLELRKQWWNA